MRVFTRALFAVAILLAAGGQFLRGDDYYHHPSHRVQLAFPMSDPFRLGEAVNLPEWDQIQRITELIHTPEGSLALLHSMPLVETRYSDPSYFLDLTGKWQERIPVLSNRAGAVDADNSSWVLLEDGRTRTIAITFHNKGSENSLTIMTIAWDGPLISRLDFASGFAHTLPPRHRFRNRCDRD